MLNSSGPDPTGQLFDDRDRRIRELEAQLAQAQYNQNCGHHIGFIFQNPSYDSEGQPDGIEDEWCVLCQCEKDRDAERKLSDQLAIELGNTTLEMTVECIGRTNIEVIRRKRDAIRSAHPGGGFALGTRGQEHDKLCVDIARRRNRPQKIQTHLYACRCHTESEI